MFFVTPMADLTKVCKKCQQTKASSCFTKDRAVCKECRVILATETRKKQSQDAKLSEISSEPESISVLETIPELDQSIVDVTTESPPDQILDDSMLTYVYVLTSPAQATA